jgi:hypothetical protein
MSAYAGQCLPPSPLPLCPVRPRVAANRPALRAHHARAETPRGGNPVRTNSDRTPLSRLPAMVMGSAGGERDRRIQDQRTL